MEEDRVVLVDHATRALVWGEGVAHLKTKILEAFKNLAVHLG